MKGLKSDFYTFKGNHKLIAQHCSNGRGMFMAPVEYRAGGRHKFIFIPEGKEGGGWRRMVTALWVCMAEGRDLSKPK